MKFLANTKNRVPILVIVCALSLFAFVLLSPARIQSNNVLAVEENSDVINPTSALGQRATELQAAIDANNSILRELAFTERDLKSKIEQFNVEIDLADKEIELTTIKIDELDIKLAKTQKELSYNRNLLRANLRALYKQGGASELELLAGSESFSAYVNEQAYLEKIKEGVQVATIAVVRAKQDLEIQRFTQKNLYKRQEAQRQIQVEKRAEQQKLLDDTKGDQAKYIQIIKDLQLRFDQADSSLSEMLRNQKFVSLGKVKTGEQIGLVGSSGLSTGPHIHFAVFAGGRFVDPVQSQGRLINNYLWPVPNSKWANVTQPFGCTDFELAPAAPQCPGGRIHNGLDIAGWYGDPVIAAADGDIIFRGPSGAYGYVVVIDHGNSTFTYYPHLLKWD